MASPDTRFFLPVFQVFKLKSSTSVIFSLSLHRNVQLYQSSLPITVFFFITFFRSRCFCFIPENLGANVHPLPRERPFRDASAAPLSLLQTVKKVLLRPLLSAVKGTRGREVCVDLWSSLRSSRAAHDLIPRSTSTATVGSRSRSLGLQSDAYQARRRGARRLVVELLPPPAPRQ